jgi:hypothetical protein
MRGLRDEYKEILDWMIGFTGTSLQLQSITTVHNQWLLKTRSIPYWTTSVFSSTVTDLVLIYESVTSSASIVRWITLHSWTLNFWIFLRLNRSSVHGSSYSLARIHGKCLVPVRIHGNSVSTNPYLHRTCVREPLSSNGLFSVYSLQRQRVLASRCLVMDFCSGSTIPAFRHHVTLLLYLGIKRYININFCVSYIYQFTIIHCYVTIIPITGQFRNSNLILRLLTRGQALSKEHSRIRRKLHEDESY